MNQLVSVISNRWCYEDCVGPDGDGECPEASPNLTGHPFMVTCKTCIARFHLDQYSTSARVGPTRRILAFARSAPGGVIRWKEARDMYAAGSSSARREMADALFFKLNGRRWRRVNMHFHMSLGNVLRRHFVRVEGARGLYVLKESMEGED